MPLARPRSLRGALVLGGLSLGCALLEPYPGGEDPGSQLGEVGRSRDKGSSFEGGVEQDPLERPAIDDSISVRSRVKVVQAIPGFAFIVELDFIAPAGNVVGGGIRFPGSDVVQWTLIPSLEGDTGDQAIRFGYVVAADTCDDLAALCHVIATSQFAVARNVGNRDVDRDGIKDGDFVVSTPAQVDVVLTCASCESTSCIEALPEGTCQQCGQPTACSDYYERCLSEGKPNFETDEAMLFKTFLGPAGILWQTRQGCISGEKTCENAQTKADAMPMACGI